MEKSEQEEDTVILHLNPKLYPTDVINSTAYTFLDEAYIKLEGDPENEIKIRIKSKGKIKADELADKFQNELINYKEYKNNFQKNKNIRNLIIQRALITNDPEIAKINQEQLKELETEMIKNLPEEDLGIKKPWEEDEENHEDPMEHLKDMEEDSNMEDDPQGIAIPWDEKYGKNEEKKNE